MQYSDHRYWMPELLLAQLLEVFVHDCFHEPFFGACLTASWICFMNQWNSEFFSFYTLDSMFLIESPGMFEFWIVSCFFTQYKWSKRRTILLITMQSLTLWSMPYPNMCQSLLPPLHALFQMFHRFLPHQYIDQHRLFLLLLQHWLMHSISSVRIAFRCIVLRFRFLSTSYTHRCDVIHCPRITHTHVLWSSLSFPS